MGEYQHEMLAPTEMLDIRLEFYIDPGGSGFTKHYHDWLEVIYLVNGDLEVQINSQKRHLKRTEFVVINPMSIHSTFCREGNTAILLQIPMTFLEKFMPDIREYIFAVDLESEDPRVQTKLSAVRSILQDLWIAYQFQADGYIFRCYSLIFEFIYLLVHSFSRKTDHREQKKNQKNQERIRFILEYVDKHYREQISLREIAGRTGLNEIYFSRFFKEQTGLTFLEYLNTVRLEKIRVDLLNTDRSIKDICERHGFYNEKVFRRMFRAMYGCSPREYRKQADLS